LLSLTAAAAASAQEKDVMWALSQAPADAAVVGVVRGLQELETSLKAFVGPDGDDIELVKPLEARLPAGAMDTAGPLVICVLPRGQSFTVVGLGRIKDASKIVGDPAGDNIVNAGGVHIMPMAPWAALGDDPAALKAFAAAPTRMAGLAAQRNAIGGHLIWATVNPKPLASVAKAFFEGQSQAGAGAPGGTPPKAAQDVIKWMIGLLDQAQAATVVCDIQAEAATLALDVPLVANSPLAAAAAAGLPVESYKGGLPASAHLVGAGWMRVDWQKAVVPMKALVKPLLDAMAADADEATRKSLDDIWAMYDQYVAIMGSDVAISMEPAPPGQGMYRLVETFAINDPVQYKQLGPKMAAASKDMMKAMMGQFGAAPGGPLVKMDMDFKEAAETIEGLPVDVWRMKIEVQPPPNAPPEAREQMKAMMDDAYGPDGMTIRMALVDKTAVVTIGGADILAQAIKTVRGQAPGLSADPKVAAALARLPKGACGGGVLSFANLVYMAMSMTDRMLAQTMSPEIKEAAKTANLPPLDAPATADYSTSAVRVIGDTVRMELSVPQADLRAAVAAGKRAAERMEWYMKQIRAMQEKANQQQQGAPGQAGTAPGQAAPAPGSAAP
jgi:hypothetical protein